MFSPFNLTPDIPSAIYTSHLNSLTNNDEQTKPLWGTNLGRFSSTNNFEQEYYEIEILTDKAENADLPFEKNMDDILNINKYLCHICNVEVPKAHMKEHNCSIKHKTCYNIANLALERTKQQIQLDVAVSRKVEILETFFCEPCAAVVLNADKEKHEKTKTHQISLKHDELLSDLLEIYTDRNNVEVESEIDELELLQQRIEAESIQDESQNTETEDEDVETVDLKAMQEEVLNVLKDELKTALDAEIQSALDCQLKMVNNEMSEVREFINRVKHETSMLQDQSNALQEKMVHQHNKLHNLQIDDSAPKISRNARNKTYKRLQIQKKKERFNKYPSAAEKDTKVSANNNNSQICVNETTKTVIDTKTSTDFLNEENLSTKVVVKDTANNTLEIENDTSEEVIKDRSTLNTEDNSLAVVGKEDRDGVKDSLDDETNPLAETNTEPVSFENSNGPLKQLANKIETIMSKYFDSSRTIDALTSTEKEHDKNKANKEMKHIEKKNKKENHKSKFKGIHVKGSYEQVQNENDTKQDIANNETNEIIEENNQNKNIEQQKEEDKTKKRDKYYKEQNDSIEENNNNKDDQNDNKNNEQNKENIEKNENKQEKSMINNKENNNAKNKKLKDQNKKQEIINTNLAKQCVVSKRNKPLTPSFSLVYYLKDISRRCETVPIHIVEAITDSIVQITAINGDKFKVLVNNFHSFHTKASDIYCKVCESPNVRRPEWHIAENEHRAKVMIPINDLNGIRQLDDIWSHCILCNDLTKSVDFHLQCLMHKNKVKHCLVELGSNNTENSKVNEKKQIQSNKGSIITALILKNNLAMTNKHYLKCIVCDVIVNYDLMSVQQHITSFDHLNNSEKQQNENKLVDIDDERFYCIGCDVHISKIDNIPHCKGKKHNKLLLELSVKHGEELAKGTDGTEIVLESISQSVKKQAGGQIEDSELICFVCNMIIYCVDEHTDSFGHKKSYIAYLEANKLNELEPDTFYCIPCNTVITIDYLMSHCTSRKHRLKLKKFPGNGQSEIENVQAEDKDSDNKMPIQVPSTSQAPTPILLSRYLYDRTMRLKVLYQFREMTDPTKLLCTVCDEEVTYSRKLAEYHISTLDHVVAFNLMMLWNKIKKRDDKYFCDICCSDMTYFSEITHVLGKQHANNLAKEPKGTVYEYDRTLVTHAYAMSHKVGNRTRSTSIVSIAKPMVQECNEEG